MESNPTRTASPLVHSTPPAHEAIHPNAGCLCREVTRMYQNTSHHVRKELVGIIILSLCIVLQAVGQDHHETSGVSAAAQRLGHRYTRINFLTLASRTKDISNQVLHLNLHFFLVVQRGLPSFFYQTFLASSHMLCANANLHVTCRIKHACHRSWKRGQPRKKS